MSESLAKSELIKLQKQAEIYISEGKALEAIAIYERIIHLEPNFAPAHSDLGRALDSQGWQELAIPYYAKALELAPSNYSLESHLNFGNLLKTRGKIDEAIASYQRAIALNPSYISAYQAWIATLIETHELDEAIAVYDRAEFHDLDLGGAKIFIDLGITCIEEGQLEQAIACFQKAISIQSDYASAHCNLGNALLQRGDTRDAIISFQEAIGIDPNFAEVYHNLGVALDKINKLDEAIACLEAAMSLKPDFASAQHNLERLLSKVSLN